MKLYWLAAAALLIAQDKMKTPAFKYAVVVSQATRQSPDWGPVVKKLEKKYNAKVFAYTQDVSETKSALAQYFPKYVCVVARPEELAGKSTVIRSAWSTIRGLDEDPYEDAIWAVLTGYDASDAMRIVDAKPLVVKRGLSHVGGGWLEWFDTGLSFSEGTKNAKFVKTSGKSVEKVRGPDDTTAEWVSAVNRNDCDMISSSGHATEANWEMGYSFPSGMVRCSNGTLNATSSERRRFDIVTSNPKIYLGVGNCLIGHVSQKNCMALAWIHSGANHFFGHIVPQSQPCYAWAIPDYFCGSQGRMTYAEAIYAHYQGMQFEMSEMRKSYPCCTKGGRSTVLYGDPAWDARMKKAVDPIFEQDLDFEEKEKTVKITLKITANRDGEILRYPLALLPRRIANSKVDSSNAEKTVVTDNFIMIKTGPMKKGDTRTVVVSASLAD